MVIALEGTRKPGEIHIGSYLILAAAEKSPSSSCLRKYTSSSSPLSFRIDSTVGEKKETRRQQQQHPPFGISPNNLGQERGRAAAAKGHDVSQCSCCKTILKCNVKIDLLSRDSNKMVIRQFPS